MICPMYSQLTNPSERRSKPTSLGYPENNTIFSSKEYQIYLAPSVTFHTQTHILKDPYNMQDSIFTNQEFTINHIEIKSILLIHVIQLFEHF